MSAKRRKNFLANFCLFLFFLLVDSAAGQIVPEIVKNVAVSSIQEYPNRILPVMREIESAQKFLQNTRNFDFLRAANGSLDPRCNEQIMLAVDGINDNVQWSLKMLDASSKIPSGILMGNRVDLGMFDECTGIRETIKMPNRTDGRLEDEIVGRHCMYTVRPTVPGIPLEETLAICVPATCDASDVKLILEMALEFVNDTLNVNLPIEIGAATCSSVEVDDWTPGGIVTLVGFSALLLFLVVCTICDFYGRYEKADRSRKPVLNVLSQFSLYGNAIRILSTKTNAETLPAIQGIRFYSMCWVIYGHGYLMNALGGSINLADGLKWLPSWSAVYMLIAPFAVDTFFTMSGFLMSYLFIKEMSKGRKFNIFAYYIHRYLRLTPALGAMLLLTIFIFPRMGSGALWERNMNFISDNCRENWWPMLLYVQNYIDKEHLMCLAHSWYLAVEMHFFWLSPFVLWPLAKMPKLGLAIWSLAFAASILTPAIIAQKNGYTGALVSGTDANRMMENTANFYMESHIRAVPWLIGVFFGFLVHTQKGVAPNKMTNYIGWVLTIIGFAFCFFSMRIFQATDYNYEEAWEIFYIVVAKPFWALGVSWIIYASIGGFAGPIRTFLSYSIYSPFSRISYCMYLVHFIIQTMKVSALRVPRYFNDFVIFNEFLSDFLLCVTIGFIFTLIFESPILTLEKMIMKRDKNNGRTTNSNGIDNPGLIKE